VALTANALRDDEAAALGAGLDGFLVKPFSFEDLTAVLPGNAAAAGRKAS
jgi:CheY-like chemotaxis protein